MALSVGELEAGISLDADGFEKGLDKAEGDFDKFGGKVTAIAKRVAETAGKSLGDGPTTGARKYGEAIGGVGEKADASEARILGAKDTVDGLATVMQGPGQQGMGAYLQGWADLASGVANFIIPAVKAVVTTGAQTVATIAHTAASKAAAVGTKAWAAVQWLLNAALTANPIGLVVVAIAALVAVFIIAWKHSETFRNVVTGALHAVLAVATAVGKWFRDTFWPWLRGVWNAVAGAVGTMVTTIGTKWNGLITWLTGIPGRISKAVSGAWSGITGALSTAVTWIHTTGDNLIRWVGGLPSRVGKAVGGMFDGIKGAFRSAINYVIGKWNDLNFSIPGVDTHIPGIGTVGGFTLNTPNIPYLAKGGRATRPGLAVVGDQGAEVVRLSQGDTVYPQDRIGAQPAKVVIELKSSGSAWDNLLLETLRRSIRVQGGNVQMALGQGAVR